MKGQFPQFDLGAELDYKEIWEESLFVFDTNVLLNLYRYQTATRDKLLDVLNQLSDRIWVPHHVALEFQRNRFIVIADQNKRFSDVKAVVSKAQAGLRNGLDNLQLERRHSLIDAAPLLDGVDKLVGEFLSSLDDIQENQQKLTDSDSLKDKIERLFEGRVGPEVGAQSDIDEVYKVGEARYKLEIPPGYMDAKKEKSGPAEYVHGGIYYKRKYGDYLIWHQLLAHAKEQEIKSIVFVTDDAKDDWWWQMQSDGPKTLGPRPELRDEAKRVAGVTQFNMYKPEGFLKYANNFLETEVSQEALQEVRDVSRIFVQHSLKTLREAHHVSKIGVEASKRLAARERYLLAEDAVAGWLRKRNTKVVENLQGFPDFIVETEDHRKHGVEVKLALDAGSFPSHVVLRGDELVGDGNLDEFTVVLVANNETAAISLYRDLFSVWGYKLPNNINICIGTLHEALPAVCEFVEVLTINGNRGQI